MRPSSRSTAPPRRRVRALAAAAAVLAVLTASSCGGDSGGPAADGTVTLRFNWWGSDARHQVTRQAIEAYQQENPKVRIQGEFGDWSGYWDKLATTVAANDAPDVIQMDEKYLREYAERGALLDLAKADGLQTGDFDQDVLGGGRVEDGLYGLNAGINTFTIVANPEVFKAAGVPLPDDRTWTWDDYGRIATRISQKLTGKAWGTTSFGSVDGAVNMWARQRGESLFTADGKLGIGKDVLTGLWEKMVELQRAKAIPTAELTSQDSSVSLDQSLMATGKAAMSYAWSNQLNALSKASGVQLRLLRLPSLTGKASENGAYYKGSMYWSVSSRSRNAAEAARFVSYLANSPAAGNVLLAERGVPPNTRIRAAVAGKLQAADKASQAFVEEIAPELGEPSPPPPIGGGRVDGILLRYATEVMFDRLPPDQAAQRFIDEVNGELGQ